MVPVYLLWLHVLFTPVSYQQLSLGTAPHCSLHLPLGLILQPQAQGASQRSISFPRYLSLACNQAACTPISYTGAVLERTFLPLSVQTPHKHPLMAAECVPTCWVYGRHFLVLPQSQVSRCFSTWEVDLVLTTALRLLLQRNAKPARESAPGNVTAHLLHWECPDWRFSSGSVFGVPGSGF